MSKSQNQHKFYIDKQENNTVHWITWSNNFIPFFSSYPVSDFKVWLLLCRESLESSFSSKIPAKLIFLSYRCRSISGSKRSRQVSRSLMWQTGDCKFPLQIYSPLICNDGSHVGWIYFLCIHMCYFTNCGIACIRRS